MYAYGWSINVSVNPQHLTFIRVWIGDTHWTWIAKHPFTVKKVDERKRTKDMMKQAQEIINEMEIKPPGSSAGR